MANAVAAASPPPTITLDDEDIVATNKLLNLRKVIAPTLGSIRVSRVVFGVSPNTVHHKALRRLPGSCRNSKLPPRR
jgi:hypothetical protein